MMLKFVQDFGLWKFPAENCMDLLRCSKERRTRNVESMKKMDCPCKREADEKEAVGQKRKTGGEQVPEAKYEGKIQRVHEKRSSKYGSLHLTSLFDVQPGSRVSSSPGRSFTAPTPRLPRNGP